MTPPPSFHYDERDRITLRRTSAALLALSLAIYAAAACALVPLWLALITIPALLLRQFLVMHELMHVAPPSRVDVLTRLFPVLETPLSLGYRELRRIHLAHHRATATPDDPEWHQIHGPAIRAFLAAMIAPESAFVRSIRVHGMTATLARDLLIRNTMLAIAVLSAPDVFVAYWITLRLTIGASQFAFHHLLHSRHGRYGTFALELPRALTILTTLFVGRRSVLIMSHHDAHHAWPSVRAERLPGLLDAFPPRSKEAA